MMDIMPRGDGHALVIPKAPSRNILDIEPSDLAALYATVQKVARAATRAFGAEGITIQQFNEPAGGQVVFHTHVHVIPRHEGVSLKPHTGERADDAVLAAQAEKLRAAMAGDQLGGRESCGPDRAGQAVGAGVGEAELVGEPGKARPQPGADPHGRLAPPAPDERHVDRQDDEPQRHHPEAEDRQEAQKAAEDQGDADAHAGQSARRQGHGLVAELDAAHIWLGKDRQRFWQAGKTSGNCPRGLSSRRIVC
jgi:histidine triad (HIT) family protein